MDNTNEILDVLKELIAIKAELKDLSTSYRQNIKELEAKLKDLVDQAAES